MSIKQFVSRGVGRPAKINTAVADTSALLIQEVNETILALKELRVRSMEMVKSLMKRAASSENIEHQLEVIGVLSSFMKNLGSNVGTLKRATEKLPAQIETPEEESTEEAEQDLVATYINK